MSYCNGVISKDIKINCEDPIVPGIEPNGVIINRNDVDFSEVAFNATRKNVIEDFVLKTGKRGYKIHVPTTSPFTGTTTTLEEGTNRKTFTNNVGFVILDNDPEVADMIDSLATGEFVIVYENKYKNINKETTPGDSAFQVVGYYQGLKGATLENDKYSEDTEGGWNVVLTETKAPKSALFLYKTDLATTRAAFEALSETPA